MGTADEYYSEYAKNSIEDFVMKIIDNEAPISRKLLMHKVLNGWNISRSGTRVEGIFQSVIENIEKKETNDDERIFYWKNGTSYLKNITIIVSKMRKVINAPWMMFHLTKLSMQ